MGTKLTEEAPFPRPTSCVHEQRGSGAPHVSCGRYRALTELLAYLHKTYLYRQLIQSSPKKKERGSNSP